MSHNKHLPYTRNICAKNFLHIFTEIECMQQEDPEAQILAQFQPESVWWMMTRNTHRDDKAVNRVVISGITPIPESLPLHPRIPPTGSLLIMFPEIALPTQFCISWAILESLEAASPCCSSLSGIPLHAQFCGFPSASHPTPPSPSAAPLPHARMRPAFRRGPSRPHGTEHLALLCDNLMSDSQQALMCTAKMIPLASFRVR